MARKEKKYHFIYKTTNLLNGKYYIGMHSTDNLNDGYMGSGKRLSYSIGKHGKDNHRVEILEYLNSRIDLKKREKEIINSVELLNVKCMNLQLGGGGGFINEEHIKKCHEGGSEWLKNRWKNDIEFRESMILLSAERMKEHHKKGKIKYDTFTGKSHALSSKNKMSEKAKLRTGDKNSQFGTCWITKDGLNKKIKKIELNKYILLGWISGRK